MGRTALFIVDVQNDFLPPDGSLAVPRGREIIPVIGSLLDRSTWDWDLVIATQVRIVLWHSLMGRIIIHLGIYPSQRRTRLISLSQSLR